MRHLPALAELAEMNGTVGTACECHVVCGLLVLEDGLIQIRHSDEPGPVYRFRLAARDVVHHDPDPAPRRDGVCTFRHGHLTMVMQTLDQIMQHGRGPYTWSLKKVLNGKHVPIETHELKEAHNVILRCLPQARSEGLLATSQRRGGYPQEVQAPTTRPSSQRHRQPFVLCEQHP